MIPSNSWVSYTIHMLVTLYISRPDFSECQIPLSNYLHDVSTSISNTTLNPNSRFFPKSYQSQRITIVDPNTQTKNCALDSSFSHAPHTIHQQNLLPLLFISRDISIAFTSKTCCKSECYWPRPNDHHFHLSPPCQCSEFLEGTYLSTSSFHN